MIKYLLPLLMMLPSTASAARAVMEGINATKVTILIDTNNARVDLATGAYGGSVSAVSLYTTSNVVIGVNDSIVIYATGSIMVGGQLVQTGSGSGVTQTSSPTWSGRHSFAADSPIAMGPTAGDGHRSALSVWAQSVDGATQSSGCLVAFVISNAGDSGIIQFTSTTTVSVAGSLGVLLDSSCAPGAVCRVAYSGFVRTIVNGSATVGGPFSTSTTRCSGQNGTQGQGTASVGRILNAGSGAGSYVWAAFGLGD